MAKKKSWNEKLTDSKDLPKVTKVDEKLAGKWGTQIGDTLLIPAPIEVDEIMRSVPEGKLITVTEIREKLAKKHNATVCCPMTTGIFVRIAAEASEERAAKGDKDITPYWRTLKSGGILNEKYPGGKEKQKELLEKEGFVVIKKGKKYIVDRYEEFLV